MPADTDTNIALQDLAEASKDVARQKATLAAAGKTDKSLAAECAKRTDEHAKLQARSASLHHAD